MRFKTAKLFAFACVLGRLTGAYAGVGVDETTADKCSNAGTCAFFANRSILGRRRYLSRRANSLGTEM